MLAWRGHHVINPYFKGFHAFPARAMEREFRAILAELGLSRFPVMIEHGCGNGAHYSRFLKKFTDRLVGVDIIDPKDVKHVDEYLAVSSDW